MLASRTRDPRRPRPLRVRSRREMGFVYRRTYAHSSSCSLALNGLEIEQMFWRARQESNVRVPTRNPGSSRSREPTSGRPRLGTARSAVVRAQRDRRLLLDQQPAPGRRHRESSSSNNMSCSPAASNRISSDTCNGIAFNRSDGAYQRPRIAPVFRDRQEGPPRDHDLPGPPGRCAGDHRRRIRRTSSAGSSFVRTPTWSAPPGFAADRSKVQGSEADPTNQVPTWAAVRRRASRWR